MKVTFIMFRGDMTWEIETELKEPIIPRKGEEIHMNGEDFEGFDDNATLSCVISAVVWYGLLEEKNNVSISIFGDIVDHDNDEGK